MNNLIYDYLDELFPDPKCELIYNKDYELLIAIVLSAQTTDKRVNKVSKVLFSRYPTIEDLANANVDDIASIIKEIGTYRKKAIYVHDIASIIKEIGTYRKKAIYVHDIANSLIGKDNLNDRKFLESLNGVGRKTVNVFLSEFYDIPNIGVDTHVARVSKRLKLVKENDDVLSIEKRLMEIIPKSRWNRSHLQFVLFGRYKCKAVNPDCDTCKLKSICGYYKNR